MRAAVPNYVGNDFSKAPPGHRFRLYFEVWRDHVWDIDSNKKKDAVERVLPMEPARELVNALRVRSSHLAPPDALTLDAVATAPFVTGMGMEHPLENGFAFLDPYGVPYLPGSSVKGVVRRAAEELALFEEDSRGWSLPAVWWLFGFDAKSGFFPNDKKKKEEDDPEPICEERARWRTAYLDSLATGARTPEADDLLTDYRKLVDPKGEIGQDNEAFIERLATKQTVRNAIHTRGSLAFWDVIPVPGEGEAANLRVDIMNPHYSHYYQKGEAPHDAGSPNPIFFLTVPPGWRFRFTVALHRMEKLPPWFKHEVNGRPHWRALVEAAFEQAFHWLGFGAKTSLGYGAMVRDADAERRLLEERERRARAEERRRREEEQRAAEEAERRRLEAMSPIDRAMHLLLSADHETFIAVYQQLDDFDGRELCRLARALKRWMEEHGEWKVKKKKGKKWERVQRIKAILAEVPCSDEN